MRSNLNMPHSLPQRSGGFRDYEKDAPITVLGCAQARLVGKLSSAHKSLPRKLCYLPPTHPAREEKVQGRKKWLRCPELTGFRRFENFCEVPSPSPGSPPFQRKPCPLQPAAAEEKTSTKSRAWYEIRAISSAVAEHSLPPCKCATLEDTVITNVGAAVWQSPPAKYVFSFTLTILNFDLQFATPMYFYQPAWLYVYVAKTQSELFPVCSPPPPPFVPDF